jgi:hypothetical protein
MVHAGGRRLREMVAEAENGGTTINLQLATLDAINPLLDQHGGPLAAINGHGPSSRSTGHNK